MTDRSAFHGPITVSSATEQIKVDTVAPALYDDYVSHAKLAAEINLDADGRYLFVAATSVGSDWPSIVVALRYEPNTGGFDPGSQ